MRLGLVWAQARKGVIGKDNAMPWHLPEDLAHFKALTLGAPVIMGRRTWDSLPARFRPLPGRRNIVITRQADWAAPGAERVGSVDEAIALCGDAPAAWVVGGAQVYSQALAHAHEAHVTDIDADFEGDAYAPTLGPEWVEVKREPHVSTNGLQFSFITYHNSSRP